MIKTLRESKAKLSALVERAAQGEEIIITVRGKPKARLCPLSVTPETERVGKESWARTLREARAKYAVCTVNSGAEIIDDLRSERS